MTNTLNIENNIYWFSLEKTFSHFSKTIKQNGQNRAHPPRQTKPLYGSSY